MQGFLLRKGKGQLRGSSSADQTWKIRSYFLFRYNLILVHIYGLCWVSETKLRTKAGAGGQSGKTISLVPEESFLSSDCSACSDAVLPLKGKAGFQKQSISVRTDSKSLSLLARKHDDKKFNTVRFGTCLPVCWPTQVCTLPWFPRSSRQSLPCCLARRRTSGSLAHVWPVTPKPETFYVNVVDDMPKLWLGKTAEQAGWHWGSSVWKCVGGCTMERAHMQKSSCMRQCALYRNQTSVFWLVTEQLVL